ncbi:FIG00636015: hypothetical protein [hydrothermal vent metagenome]|uniref:TraB/GumN family protein n=1 Tax=hydrothermal vent metagenome TaxID=652676 RepID=A0A3B0RME5_9ZZZZ
MTKSWISYLLLFTLYLLLTACPSSAGSVVSASNDALPKEAQTKIAQMPEDADPALWVIKDEDTTIYLFGTVHILKPGMTWFDEAVKDAFDNSDELVIEMIAPDAAGMAKLIGEIAIDKTGVKLRDKLSAEDRLDYEKALISLNLPVEAFDPLEPWFASVNLALLPLMANGYDGNNGVEDTLKSNAKARKLKISGLETAEQQLGFFDQLPEDVQIRFLNFTVDTVGELADGMDNMVAEWANANVEGLAELMNAGLEEKILYDTLLANRNATWAAWVEERMKQPGNVFLAVGAGHLAGADSLQQKLAARGLVSQRIEY